MTISSTTRKAGPFDGNGVTTSFPFTFNVFTAADMLVVRLDTATDIESTLTLTTDYTVALNTNQSANPGGTVTLTAPLARGTTLVVTSAIDYLQPTDITNGGGFYPRVISDALDRLTILSQQLKEEVDRAAKVSITGGTDAATLVKNINNLAAVLDNINTVATPYQSFDGDGVTLDFTLSSAPGSIGAVEVYVGGLNRVPGKDYTLNGSTLSFTAAPAVGVGNIFVRWVAVQAIASVADGSVSTAKLATSAVTTTTIAAGAVTTSRLADSAVTSVKLDAAGVVLPTGSTVYVPDISDDSAKPAPTQWVKDLTATTARDGLARLAGTTEVNAATPSASLVCTVEDLRAGNLVSAASVSASGVAVNFTTIPSWAKRITIMFESLSTNGTSVKMVRLGDAGGIESTGYLSSTAFQQNGVASSVANYTDGFALSGVNASDALHGSLVLTKLAGNQWIANGNTGFSSGGAFGSVAGSKTLSATLDRVQLTTQGGADTFDAGTVSITYE